MTLIYIDKDNDDNNDSDDDDDDDDNDLLQLSTDWNNIYSLTINCSQINTVLSYLDKYTFFKFRAKSWKRF